MDHTYVHMIEIVSYTETSGKNTMCLFSNVYHVHISQSCYNCPSSSKYLV